MGTTSSVNVATTFCWNIHVGMLVASTNIITTVVADLQLRMIILSGLEVSIWSVTLVGYYRGKHVGCGCGGGGVY